MVARQLSFVPIWLSQCWWDATTGAEKQTLETIIGVQCLSFSIDGKYLKTDRGMLSLNSDSLSHQEQRSCAIFVNREWVTQDGQNILWLPPDYRAMCTTVYNNKLALGHSSGQVTFLNISTKQLSSIPLYF